ncbi:hypothetical protein BT96DRAFT_997801 [Gymnopus androsaceus JB14]|uniref:Uncharacterized protein n=1 Tax=Gymnopus androsaceus JB14 TaxID=1447944 RepID=A0A6A4HAN1_9AGAR|nr:hypothetical protein BT96DRAFT_997801 [Gymnopus androsaceus JB14]
MDSSGTAETPVPAKAKCRRQNAADIGIEAMKWTVDLVNSLLTIIERLEIQKKMFGINVITEDGEEKANGDSKSKCLDGIARELFPTESAINIKSMSLHIAGKIVNLQNTYRKKAAQLKQTGGGVQEDVPLYVPNTGPDHDTAPLARNIWDRLISDDKWPFFARCHSLWATCNSTIPPMATTGIGPHGRTATVYRPLVSHPLPFNDQMRKIAPIPDELLEPAYHELLNLGDVIPDSLIDPILLQQVQRSEPIFAHTPTATKVVPKTSSGSSLSEMAQKAQASVHKAPPKADSFEDKVLKISSTGMKLSRKREQEQLQIQRQQLHLDEQRQVLQEKNAGLLSTPQAKQMLARLVDEDTENDDDAHPSPSIYHCKRRRVSPEWSCEGDGNLASSDVE